MAHRNNDERRTGVYYTLAREQRPLEWSEVRALARFYGCSTSAIRADIARLLDAVAEYRFRLPVSGRLVPRARQDDGAASEAAA